MPLRRRLHLREMLKRRKHLGKNVVFPKKPFFAGKNAGSRWVNLSFNPRTKKILLTLLLLIFLIGGGYFFFFSEAVHIQEIVFFRGQERVDSAPFSFPAQELIGKHLFFFPQTEIRRQQLAQYNKELQSLVIRRKIPSTLVVRYETFPEIAAISIRLNGMERKFLLNQFGVVISEDAEGIDLPTLTGSFEKFPKRREALIPAEHIQSMTRAYRLFTEKFGMKVPVVLYKKIEKEVHLKTERDFWIWLDLTQEVEPQLFKLKRALPKLDIYHEALFYIDLRISGRTGDKVIFKRK